MNAAAPRATAPIRAFADMARLVNIDVLMVLPRELSGPI
jgi:hypothetical protein